MTSLDRYILRQCFTMMIFVTAALSAAVWLAQSLRLVDLIVNRGLSVALFSYMALLILPRFLDIVLPIGAFIAVLFVFNRLTSESELVVMRAAGLGPLVLARPVFMLAGLAFVVLMSLSAYFLPASNREFKDLQFEIRNRFVSALLQEGAFTTISDKLTIYFAGRNERGEVIGLLINDDRDPRQPVTIRPRDRKAVYPDLRPLHARSGDDARCSGGPLSRRAGALSRRVVLAAGRSRPVDPRQFFCRG